MTHDHEVAAKVARAELVKRVLIVVTAFMVGTVLLGMFVLLDEVRSTQQTGSPTLKAIAAQQDDIEVAAKAGADVNATLADCLTPGGECYERSAERQALIYYVLVCQDAPGQQTLKQLQVCAATLQARNQDR